MCLHRKVSKRKENEAIHDLKTELPLDLASQKISNSPSPPAKSTLPNPHRLQE